jgi:GTP-binding protein EngB required for normal cell division
MQDSRAVKDLIEETAGSVQDLYRKSIDPLAKKFAFEKRPVDGEISGGPLVLFVGNHSSGKSTFINHLLGEAVQRTGMAPTDDCFTILRYGKNREERDGRAIVSNPDLPFSGAAHIGPEFLSHFRMRLLPNEFLRDITLVDTPGMIDAAGPDTTRGYNFSAGVRWFAERADLVLVFFDPDRPGTTAETMTELTQSLGRIDHKLLVVMNKMDQFRSLRDFARCYGTLCWNLGKVIAKKDIPQIFTTFVPVKGAAESALSLTDFAHAREELVREIKRAPVRRLDNILTQASIYGRRLKLYVHIIHATRQKLTGYRRRLYSVPVLILAAGLGAGGYLASQEMWPAAVGAAVAGLVLAVGGYFGFRELVRRREAKLLDDLDGIFERVYKRDLVVSNREEDLLLLWKDVKDSIVWTVKNLGLLSLPRLKRSELNRIDDTLSKQLPDLRAKLHRKLESKPTGF